LPIGFQPFLQPEYTDEVGRGGRAEQRRNRCRIGRRHGERVAVVFGPDVEDRVRRGIVLRPRTFRDLLARLRGDHAPRERVQAERQRERNLSRRGLRLENASDSVLHDPGRHAFVGDADALCTLGVDRAAGQHHVERRRRAGKARQALHSSPARHDAEHDFGKAEARGGVVDDDAIAARERQLEAAAQAKAPNERDRRILDGRKPLERVPAATHDGHRVGLAADDLELLDIGARDETARLARRDHETGGRLAVEKIERRIEFSKHVGA
jgi:hypothetical protein